MLCVVLLSSGGNSSLVNKFSSDMSLLRTSLGQPILKGFPGESLFNSLANPKVMWGCGGGDEKVDGNEGMKGCLRESSFWVAECCT